MERYAEQPAADPGGIVDGLGCAGEGVVASMAAAAFSTG
jgi:nitrogenase subunit NifH